jgi:magnesium transporter
MEISTFKISENGLDPIALDDLIAEWQSGDGSHWVDAVGDPSEVDNWRRRVLERIGASAFVERAVFNPIEAASVVSTGRAVYFKIPAIIADRDDPIVYVNGLVLENLLVTWRFGTIDGIDELLDGLKSPTDLPWVTTTSDLVAALCVNFSTVLFKASQDLRHRIDMISDEASGDDDIDGVELDAANSRLHVIDLVAGDYSHVFPMLRDSDSKALDLGGDHSRIQIAATSSDALARRVRLYYERVAQLRQQQVQEDSDKTNRRLGVLSVMSVIFLPLTLLAGIFGMNFQHMPSLTWSWTYPALLLLMATTAVVLWRYFKKNEWI